MNEELNDPTCSEDSSILCCCLNQLKKKKNTSHLAKLKKLKKINYNFVRIRLWPLKKQLERRKTYYQRM